MVQGLKKYNIEKELIYIQCGERDLFSIENLLQEDNFIFIYLFEKGNGSHIIGSQIFPIRDMQVHIVLPGQQQQLYSVGPISLYLMMLSKSKYAELINGIKIPTVIFHEHPSVTISRDATEILLREYKDIAFEILEETIFMEPIIDSKIKIILQCISRELYRTCEDLVIYEKHPVLFTFIVLIKKHYKEQRSVSFYAGRLGLTANYLNVLCQKHLKCTASKIIDRFVIPVLQQEVVDSQDSIVNIAYEYSFQNYVHFSRYFKKYVGISPMAYRKKK